MTPYYADDQVTLYLGDCREVIEWLGADILVTDPPYGRKSRSPQSHTGRMFFGDYGRIVNDESTATRDAALALWGDRTAAVFGDLVLPPIAGTKQTLIYRKPPNAGSFGALGPWRRDVEAIYLAGPWPTSVGGSSSVLATAVRHTQAISGRQFQHPHAKPLDVMEALIAACPDGVIADPFAGVGSSLVAARNLGRRAVGVEISEEYAEKAARRLSQMTLLAG